MKDRMQEEADTYEQLFIQFSGKVEKLLVKTAGILALLLLLVQASLQFSVIRQWVVKVERLEGIPFVRHHSEQE